MVQQSFSLMECKSEGIWNWEREMAKLVLDDAQALSCSIPLHTKYPTQHHHHHHQQQHHQQWSYYHRILPYRQCMHLVGTHWSGATQGSASPFRSIWFIVRLHGVVAAKNIKLSKQSLLASLKGNMQANGPWFFLDKWRDLIEKPDFSSQNYVGEWKKK